MDMDDEGEPIALGQVDRKAADALALRNTLFAVAFFGGVWLVNGILVILLIGLLQAIGWWEATTGDAQPVTTELLSPLLLRIRARTDKGLEVGLGVRRLVPRQPEF